jgi:hypothetical protein
VDGVDWGNLAEWAGVLAAVGIAVWGWMRAGTATRKAEETQTRSMRALEAAAAAQGRLATLAEAQAENQQKKPPWQITVDGQMRRRLFNAGHHDTYDVSIDGESILSNGPARREWDRIGGGESVEFYAARTINQVDDMATVAWRWDPGGELQTWRWALP